MNPPAVGTDPLPLEGPVDTSTSPPPVPAQRDDLLPVLPAWALHAAAALALFAALLGGLWASTHLHADEVLLQVARFGHVAALVLAFGAVLAIDWVALLWLLGRRGLPDVLRAAADSQVPVWAGYAALVLTGLLLQPDLADPLTRTKVGLVLLVGWNGLVALWLHRLLSHRPRRVHVRVSLVSGAVSQAGWWGALLIGFLNSR